MPDAGTTDTVTDTMTETIDDTGLGLSPADMGRLFHRFQRLSARPTAGESSTGLGLSIVRRVAEAHGGRAWATSDGVGQGSAFHVWLPLG